MTENDIQRDIIDCLKSRGYEVIRINAGGYRGRTRLAPPGTPDVLALGDNGETLWLEVKTATGVLSDAQVAWHSRMRQRGHRVEVVRSVEEVEECIRY